MGQPPASTVESSHTFPHDAPPRTLAQAFTGTSASHKAHPPPRPVGLDTHPTKPRTASRGPAHRPSPRRTSHHPWPPAPSPRVHRRHGSVTQTPPPPSGRPARPTPWRTTMTIANPNPQTVPTYDPSTMTTAPDKPRPHLRARARRTGLRARHALVCLARRAVSAPLGLSWRLDLTVFVDAEVVADHRESAMATLQEFLRHPQTSVVVSCPTVGPPAGASWAARPFASFATSRSMTRASHIHGSPGPSPRSSPPASSSPPATLTPTATATSSRAPSRHRSTASSPSTPQ